MNGIQQMGDMTSGVGKLTLFQLCFEMLVGGLRGRAGVARRKL